MKTKRLFFIVLMAIFISQANAQIISTEQETQIKELPGIEPVEMKAPIDIIPIITDLSGRNLTLTGYARGGGPGNSLKINTGNGTIDIGAMNTSWAHIYTDKPNFIFNKPVFTANGIFSSYSTSNLYLRTNTTDRLTILNSNGYVGIGTTNPLASLHIYKSYLPNLIVENAITKFHISIANNPGECDPFAKKGDVVLRSLNGGKNDHHGLLINMANDDNDGNSYIRFTDNLRIIMGIYNNAVVKINGKLEVKQINVKTAIWGDFVFNDDYALPSLTDLENYIKEHRHLPGVPSEKEVIENGINVSEMNVILMQKIEELTLYVIEQDKKMKELEKEVKALKNN